MTDFYPAAISGDTALQGSEICDAWFDADAWAPDCAALDGRDPELFATAASELLYLATGRRWPGVCEVDVRPCSGLCGCWLDYAGWDYCATCRLPCDTARLPSPIHQVQSVTIDGAVLDVSEYRLINGEYLKRTTGVWPWQDYTQAPGLERTWSVNLLFGAVPPPLGVLAAKALACWLAQADPAADCALPAHVQSLSRQGINQQFDPKMTAAYSLPAVNLFITSYGQGTADVWSPDQAPLPPEVF